MELEAARAWSDWEAAEAVDAAHVLLLAGSAADRRALVPRAYDAAARVLADDAEAGRHPAAALVLLWAFVAPRPERLAEDLARVDAVLAGEGGFPALSAGDLASARAYPLHRALGRAPRSAFAHLVLPEALPHPAARTARARALGWSEAALEAVRSEEAYLEAGQPTLWPWYPEQDAVLRPRAEQRAGEAGLALPPRHLDAPWEAAWYRARAGEAAIAAALEGRSSAPPLRLRRVPRLPRALWPPARAGELATLHERVAHLVRVAEAMGEGEARARLRAPLHALVTRLVGALDDRPPPPRGVEVRPPGPDEVAEVPPEGATIAGLWAEGEGVVLALPDALLRIGPSGRVQARLAYAGEVLHVGRGHALILGWGDEDEGLPLRLLALEEGRWRAGRVELDAVFGGPVLPPTWTLAMGGDIGPGPRTPDGACWVDPEGQVVRLVDDVVVPEDALPPLWDEEWDDERDEAGGADEAAEEPPGARARPPLLPVLSGRRVHVDGVTFELGGAEEAPVGEELARAAVDLGDRWRTCFGAWLGEGPERVAWLGAPATHAAFSEDGRTLWIVAAGHLHEIEWHASPRWRRAFSLAGLAEPATERLREVAP